MARRKICVVVTARPSYSRIKTALQAIAAHPDLELQLVVAGSALLDRYGTAVQMIEADGFDVAARVQMVIEGGNLPAMAKTTGHRTAGAGDGLRASATGRGGHRRGPLRDHRDRHRRGVPEHSGRPRAGRRGDWLDRREGPPRRHQAGRRPLRGERACRGAGAANGRVPVHRVRDRLPVDRSRRRGALQPGARLRSVHRVRRCRPVVRPVERLPRGHAAPGDDRVRAGPGADHGDALRREGLGSARALVLAQRRRRHRRHLERHPELPRDRAAGELALLQEHGAAPTSSGCCTTRAAWSATRASDSGSAPSSACRWSTSAPVRPAGTGARTCSTSVQTAPPF